MVEILIGQCDSKERFNRLMAITWVHEFVLLGREKLVEFYSALLGAIMQCISDQALEIREIAETANHDLLELVKTTTGDIDLTLLQQRLKAQLTDHHEPTRLITVRWIWMLRKKSPMQTERYIHRFRIRVIAT
jgi:vacuole morphology and inheritance protein 14